MGEKHHIASVVYKLMSMGRWWNDTERGKSEVLGKILFRVGGRWMNEYGAMVE